MPWYRVLSEDGGAVMHHGHVARGRIVAACGAAVAASGTRRVGLAAPGDAVCPECECVTRGRPPGIPGQDTAAVPPARRSVGRLAGLLDARRDAGVCPHLVSAALLLIWLALGAVALAVSLRADR